jgi:hypothetical protein
MEMLPALSGLAKKSVFTPLMYIVRMYVLSEGTAHKGLILESSPAAVNS